MLYLKIKKGTLKDISLIMDIINNAIVDMESEGIYQWDRLYPDESVINDDINNKNLYVYTDENIIKAFLVLNEIQDTEYNSINWKYQKGRQLVVHRLCVDPKFKGKGIATALIKYAEKFAKEKDYNSMRLDCFSKNPHACNLYRKNNYIERGIMTIIRVGDFFCFEKAL
ncbi:GNAT family N-acetyltransferase [Clostridium felsineum]|uniref:GNAT family N-acetyltransferase n=1 Tax=Clostridium felsineum TaxID=36839 RepID=UPI001FA81AAA|nr:GNAT family N-acetyltransferase [Clostridium felsineum]